MSGSSSSSEDVEDSWIQWFCALEGHEMFCEVDRSFIEDGFNLYGLRHWVPSINDSLDVILDRVSQHEASHELMEATCALYGLIHARYVLTTNGLEAMYAKYTLQEFGNCPHFHCRRQPVVPVGVRDEPHIETVKIFCPKCQDVYVHPSLAAQRVDGAYFGTTFPHLFFMTYGSMIPDPPEQTFVPRVFGFRVHPSAANGAYGRARGQQQQRNLEERRRLRRPASTALRARAAAGEATPRGSSATGTRGPRATGASTMVGAEPGMAEAAAARGGQSKKEGNSGEVVVHIKAEEGWPRGQAGDGREPVAAEAGGGRAGDDGRGNDRQLDPQARQVERERRNGVDNGGQQADGVRGSHARENGHPTSPIAGNTAAEALPSVRTEGEQATVSRQQHGVQHDAAATVTASVDATTSADAGRSGRAGENSIIGANGSGASGDGFTVAGAKKTGDGRTTRSDQGRSKDVVGSSEAGGFAGRGGQRSALRIGRTTGTEAGQGTRGGDSLAVGGRVASRSKGSGAAGAAGAAAGEGDSGRNGPTTAAAAGPAGRDQTARGRASAAKDRTGSKKRPPEAELDEAELIGSGGGGGTGDDGGGGGSARGGGGAVTGGTRSRPKVARGRSSTPSRAASALTVEGAQSGRRTRGGPLA